MSTLTQTSRFLELQTAVGSDVLLAESVDGYEALGRMFEYRVLALSGAEDFRFDDLIGTPASIRIDSGIQNADKSRFLHGLVSEVDHLGFDHQGLSRYQLTLVPWLWLLTRTADCKIFQHQTVPEIVQAVFADFSSADFRFELAGSYPLREYTVQYRETDYNFVQRLLEHEGIYYFWEVKDGSHTMVITDQIQSHQPVPGFEEIVYRSQDTGGQEDFHLSDWQVQHRLTPGQFSVNSYDFKAPVPSTNTKLLSKNDQDHKHPEGSYEQYDNPGDFTDLAEGERYATTRRKEVQMRAKTILSRTEARGLFTGCTFTAAEIPRSDQNGEYLVTATTITARSGNYGSGGSSSEDSYECAFTGIRKEIGHFVPERSAGQTKVEGPQTAVVSGPAGEEIYVDKYGRVKVQFLWDRNGKFDAASSCWIRVSQAWAGAGFGSMNIPRIGQEVIVDFLEGNPDRPIITGRVYNAATMPNASNAGRDGKEGNVPPVDLTKAAMMTSFKSNSLGGSGGSNEITMNDAGGAEGLFFKAQKDEIHLVGNDRSDTVTNDETREIGRDRTDSVGRDETRQVGRDRRRTVDGNEIVYVEKKRHETVNQDHLKKTEGSLLEQIDGNHSEKVGKQFQHHVKGQVYKQYDSDYFHKVGGGLYEEAGSVAVFGEKAVILSVGASSIQITPEAISIQSPAVNVNCGNKPGKIRTSPPPLIDPQDPTLPVA